jgi:hypothetical protein
MHALQIAFHTPLPATIPSSLPGYTLISAAAIASMPEAQFLIQQQQQQRYKPVSVHRNLLSKQDVP